MVDNPLEWVHQWPRGFCSAGCWTATKTPSKRRQTPLAPGRGMAASTRQRVAVMQRACLVCGTTTVDAAHLWPRDLGGCDEPACVVPLCRQHHRDFDEGRLDLLPLLVPHRITELQHALGHARGDLIALLERLTNQKWTSMEAA